MKYIVFNDLDRGDFPVLFPPYKDHADIANYFSAYQPVSAGFVKIEGGGLVAYGASFSLRLKSRGSVDTAAIESWFHLGEIPV